MPGIPSIDHSTAFLTSELTGSHEKTRRYVKLTARRRGTRQMKRKA
jgi:hypothetical protein